MLTEVEVCKPRLTYAQFLAAQRQPQDTIAALIERYIAVMNGTPDRPGLQPLGETTYYKLRQLQRMPITAIRAPVLNRKDVIEHCQRRIEVDKVCAATVQHDVTGLVVVLNYAGAAWDDCEEISAGAITAARPFLVKNNLIGKSTPRKRVPTDEEIGKLLDFFSHPKRRPSAIEITAMPDMIAFALVSSRRMGEICRILWSDIDWEHKDEQGNRAPMYLVRDMKDPRKKIGNHKSFPLFPELEEIILRQPRREGEDRIFPFRAKSASAKYTRAKKELGIVGLRFHDSRRAAITHWLKKFTPHQVRHYVSGHASVKVLERVYDVTDPAGGFAKLAQADRLAA